MPSFQCNLCLRPLQLFAEVPSHGTQNTYLSECLQHIFCEPCKIRIHPRCICRSRSRFMPICDRMPERYRSMFGQPQNIFKRLQQTEQFQEKQNHLSFQRMSQYCQQADKVIERIEHETVEQERENVRCLEQCKKIDYIFQKWPEKRKKQKATNKSNNEKRPPTSSYEPRKFIFQPSRYRNVQPISPRVLKYSNLKNSHGYYDAHQRDDSGFDY